ncbi:MAG: nickel-dependent lactate racemase [Nitrososphaerota archaeon]
MLLKLPFGKDFLKIEISEEKLEIVHSKYLEPLKDLKNAIKKSIRKPINSKPLSSLSKNKKICIIVPDKTRACPTKEILPLILEEIEKCKPIDLKILIGNGLHKPMTNQEIIEMLGKEVIEEYEIINHLANDEKELINLGKRTSYGTPAIVNKIVKKSDYVIGVGLVEPHFFAGYSGGRKIILPGVAGKEAIFNNHSYRMIDNPNANYGILNGNPIHLDMIEFMKFVNLSFIINVIINNEGKICKVFSGDPIEAHEKAVEFLNKYVNIKLHEYADIAIVSNGGYPLDRNLYQAVKGIATASRVLKNGGVIIMVAECKDGLGGHEEFVKLMCKDDPNDVLKEIKENEPINDQWQAQILAKILKKNRVIIVTKGVDHKIIKEMMMEHASTIDEALDLAKNLIKIEKPRIVAIPEGPYVIPNV